MRSKFAIGRRKGLALIMALVAMAVVTVFLTAFAAQIVAQRNLVRQRHRQLQAEWLARAGGEVAAAKLLQSAEAFKEDGQEFAPNSKVRIAAEKTGDLFTVSVESEVGLADGRGIKREASRRFRRTEKDGVVRIEAVQEK
jgi:type II secretory pathway component PulK